MPVTLPVISDAKGRYFVGTVEAFVGLRTDEGKISRMTDRSIWTIGRDGAEQLHRRSDRLPAVLRKHAGPDFKPAQPQPK